MMNSIFLSFDLNPTELSTPTMSYIYMFIPSFSYLQLYWMKLPSRMFLVMNVLLMSYNLMLSTESKKVVSSYIVISSIFYMILMMNLSGISPIMFSATSHLMLTLSMGLPLWTSMIYMIIITNITSMNSHMVPENTPPPLMNFLSAVESLSSAIRPITLSFRLAANMSAGHVILAMISASIANIMSKKIFFWVIIPFLLFVSSYSSFEIMICLVQSFVFMLLSMMYSNDYVPK